jgi:hypothetical protein
MPKVEGFIDGHGRTFTAIFPSRNGVEYQFAGNLSEDIGQFSVSTDATLDYSDEFELTHKHNFHGTIGKNSIHLKIGSNPGTKVAGPLDKRLSDVIDINGSGTWTRSFIPVCRLLPSRRFTHVAHTIYDIAFRWSLKVLGDINPS